MASSEVGPVPAGRVRLEKIGEPGAEAIERIGARGLRGDIGAGEQVEHLVADQQPQDWKLLAQALDEPQRIALRVDGEPLPRGECRRAANVGLADGGQLGRRCSVADNAVLQPMLQPPEIHLSRRHSRADS